MNYRKTAARRNRKWRWPTGNSKDKWANSYVALKHNANAKEYYFDLYEYICNDEYTCNVEYICNFD